jgi:hypothetical protein
MSPEFIRRYYVLRIISKPRVYGIGKNGYVPLKDLQKALDDKRNEFKDDFLFEKLHNHNPKTIKRDIEKIYSFFGVEILLKRNYGYYIDTLEYSKDLKEIYDKTELFLLNQRANEWKNNITIQGTSLNGFIDFVGLINAIEQGFKVYVRYNGWYDDNRFQKIEGYIQPLHIKEINKAWYLIGHNEILGIYAFCLDDRIEELTISKKKVQAPIVFNERTFYANSIGILNNHEKGDVIRLKVANHHFKYLLSNPMHHSQKVISTPVLSETEALDYTNPDIWGELELFIQPNYEFLMEILKYNIWVQVVGPKHVVDYVRHHIQLIAKYYP